MPAGIDALAQMGQRSGFFILLPANPRLVDELGHTALFFGVVGVLVGDMATGGRERRPRTRLVLVFAVLAGIALLPFIWHGLGARLATLGIAADDYASIYRADYVIFHFLAGVLLGAIWTRLLSPLTRS